MANAAAAYLVFLTSLALLVCLMCHIVVIFLYFIDQDTLALQPWVAKIFLRVELLLLAVLTVIAHIGITILGLVPCFTRHNQFVTQ
jgi:hypothetical protein